MKIITISREYGAYGNTIGKAVAAKLGIEIFDKDIVRSAAKGIGLEEDIVAEKEEAIFKSDSLLRSILPVSYSQLDAIYDIEKEAILGFAAKGPCVVVGRCADVILREAGFDTLNVFLYASTEVRAKRVGEIINSDDPVAINKVIKTMDNARKSYNEYYTDKKWGDYSNFDLMLNVGTVGIDNCVDVICSAACK